MKLIVIATSALILLMLGGCSAQLVPEGGGSKASGSTHAATGNDRTKAPSSFTDSYGGTGGAWTFPASCPTGAAVATVINMPGVPEIAAEANGTPLNDGCHYASTSLGESVEVFQDAKSYVGVTPTDPGAKSTSAPSLGKGAQVITEGSGSTACTVIAPSTGVAEFKSIVVTVFRHSGTSDANCSAAVKALEVVASQQR